MSHSPWIHTMQRCAALVAAALAFSAGPSAAQLQRQFPATALRGVLVVTQPPEALMNGTAVRLAPGARIRGTDNLLQLSATLVGQKLPVHYTRDGYGNLLDVWILTPGEGAKQPWPTTPEQAAAWTFDADAQTWSRP